MSPRKNRDLHGNAPANAEAALLLIDVINDFDFPEADRTLEYALPMARKIATLKENCRAAGVPVIYVNDNWGIWRSDFSAVLRHCLEAGSKGKQIAAWLKPTEDDYFVLKPKHSGFFSTTLGTLLEYLQCHTLILTGVAGNICVLFTANDAYMRDYSLVVPRDCVASNSLEENDYALDQMSRILKADTRPSEEIALWLRAQDFEKMSGKGSPRRE